jgi:magnesium-transporting ATPase (P-type)
LYADLEVDGGTRLADAVTMLQADGCVVMLVAPGNAAALRAADCGVGVQQRRLVHGAHICCTDLAAAAFVIEGSQVAHEVSRQSVALAVGGSRAWPWP